MMTENRPRGRHDLAPHEEERLRALLRRADALGNALDALEGQETAYPDTNAEYVEVMREEHRKANGEFAVCKRELVIPDRPGNNPRKPAPHRRGES